MLDDALAGLVDHLPQTYRQERALPTLAEAYRLLHRPRDATDVGRGRRRLALDELLLLQLGVMLKRQHRQDRLRAAALPHTAEIDERIIRRFPYELTPDQRQVIDEIVADVSTTMPMNRLLQGDVGAGKTAVALYTMLLAVAGGHQAALLAPTELLAEQHFVSIDRLLDGASVRCELLTGSMRTATRDRHRRTGHGGRDRPARRDPRPADGVGDVPQPRRRGRRRTAPFRGAPARHAARQGSGRHHDSAHAGDDRDADPPDHVPDRVR